MAKILVVGGGQGGFVAAKHLSDYGHEVHIYEKCAADEMFHPWRDDIRRAVFEEVGLSALPVEDCVQKAKWKFVSPDEQSTLNVPMTPPLEEISISREHLAKRLIAECDKCTIHFSAAAEHLIVEGEKIKGIIVGGEKIYGDLVIDASGLSSGIRKEVPACYAVPEPRADDVMYAFRGYYKVNDSENMPEPPCTLYVKHLNKVGISWCNLTVDGFADILIGRIGGLDDDEIAQAKAHLLSCHKFNSGEEIFEKKVQIALRYPSTVMVADGYALVGDSAYMTMPLMGSGIESSMKAGKLLADCIGRGNDFSAAALYKYQLAFWEKLGNDYTFIDVVKRWALNLPVKDINWAFGSGLVTNEDMALLSTDENSKGLSAGVIIKKVFIAFGNFGLICRAVKYVVRALRAKGLAKKIPKTYNRDKLIKWSNKLDKKVRG